MTTQRKNIWAYWECLPKIERRILVARLSQGQSLQKVALAVELPVSDVRMIQARALRRLAQAMQERPDRAAAKLLALSA